MILRALEGLKAQRLLLLAIVAVMGVAGFSIPLWGASTVVLYFASQTDYSEMFFTTAGGGYYRPLPLLWSKLSHDFFGLSPVPLQLFSAVLLAMFAIVVHGFYLHLSPDRRGAALLATALVLVNPAVWYSFIHRFEGELAAALFIYLVLLFFLRLCREKAPQRTHLALAAIVLFSLLAGLTTETARGLLPALLTAFALVLWWRGSLGRVGALGYVAGTAPIGILVVFQMLISMPVRYDKPLDTGMVLLLLRHNLYQIILPLSLLSVVPLMAGLRMRRALPLLGVAATLLLATPPLVLLSFDELLLISSDLHVLMPLMASLLLVVALAVHFFRGDTARRLCAGGVLAIFATVILATFFVPFVRSDTSTRTYTAAMPLLAWLFVDGLTVLRDHWRKPAGSGLAGRVERSAAGATLLLCAAALLYTAAAADINLAAFQTARASAEADGARYLASLDLGNAALYSTDSYGIATETAHLYQISPRDNTVHHISPGTTLPRGEGIQYVAFHRFQPRLPAGSPLRSTLRGDFSYAPEQDRWQSLWYDAEPTPMERSLRQNGELLFITRHPFIQVARFLDDAPARSIAGVPWTLEYDWEVSIYRVNGTNPFSAGGKMVEG